MFRQLVQTQNLETSAFSPVRESRPKRMRSPGVHLALPFSHFGGSASRFDDAKLRTAPTLSTTVAWDLWISGVSSMDSGARWCVEKKHLS